MVLLRYSVGVGMIVEFIYGGEEDEVVGCRGRERGWKAGLWWRT